MGDNDLSTMTVTGLCVAYGRHAVLNDIALTVQAGETYGLIGLNGAGKTTFIKTVLGLRTPQKGTVLIAGRDRLDPESKKELAYLPERFEPPWFLTGAEFVSSSLALYDKKIDRVTMDEWARRLALDPVVLGQRVQTYSKGMRQKLGLMATFLTGCRFLILDEPMSGLDPRARVFVKNVLHEARAQGRTIFLSSHILADMEEVCDRVAVLQGGEIHFEGAPDVLKTQEGKDTLEKSFLSLLARADSSLAAA